MTQGNKQMMWLLVSGVIVLVVSALVIWVVA